MWTFLVSRVLQAFLALMALSIMVFYFTWATGDPVYYLLPVGLEESTPELIAQLRRDHGLDKPMIVQFGSFMGRAVRGDFGYSWTAGRRPVTHVIWDRAGPTAHLGLMATVFTLVIALPLGVFAAYNRGRLADSIGRTLAFAGQSVPEFWLALVLIYIFGVGIQVNLGLADFTTAWLPIAGREGGWTHWILPTVTAGWSSMAGMLRLTRSSVLEVIGSDFVRTARAKGLPGRQVLWRHTVRNALIPIITATALLIVSMMNGIVLVEAVFGWGGIGRLLVTAVGSRDLFLVQGLTMIIGSMFLLANFLADVLYSVVDPRVKFQ